MMSGFTVMDMTFSKLLMVLIAKHLMHYLQHIFVLSRVKCKKIILFTCLICSVISDAVLVLSMFICTTPWVLHMRHPEIWEKCECAAGRIMCVYLSPWVWATSVKRSCPLSFFSSILVWSGEVSSMTHKTSVCLFPLYHALFIPHTTSFSKG